MTRRSTGPMPSWPPITGAWWTRRGRTGPRAKPRVAYCTSSERWAARWRSCRSLGVVPASLVAGRRVGPGRVVEDFGFVVITLAADNSGVVQDFVGGGGQAVKCGYIGQGAEAGVLQQMGEAGWWVR